MENIMESVTNAIYPIGMMLLIIGGGGTFKQVLIDGGVGDTIAKMFEGSNMSPILLAWIVAAVLRIALGSATVAAVSTTGIVIPFITSFSYERCISCARNWCRKCYLSRQ